MPYIYLIVNDKNGKKYVGKADNVKSRWSSHKHNAKIPIPENVGTEFKSSKAELAKIDLRISERQQAIDAIRKKFDDDKKRYLTLRNQSSLMTDTSSVASAGH